MCVCIIDWPRSKIQSPSILNLSKNASKKNNETFGAAYLETSGNLEECTTTYWAVQVLQQHASISCLPLALIYTGCDTICFPIGQFWDSLWFSFMCLSDNGHDSRETFSFFSDLAGLGLLPQRSQGHYWTTVVLVCVFSGNDMFEFYNVVPATGEVEGRSYCGTVTCPLHCFSPSVSWFWFLWDQTWSCILILNLFRCW